MKFFRKLYVFNVASCLILLASCEGTKVFKFPEIKSEYEELYAKKSASYSYVFSDEYGKIYSEYASSIYVSPASCQKVITSLVGLKYLGVDYVFTTKLSTAATKDGKDIALISLVGDPSFSSEDLISLLSPLKNHSDSLEILVDASIFLVPEYSPNLIIDDMGTQYSTPVSSMNIDHNWLEKPIRIDETRSQFSTLSSENYFKDILSKALQALKIKGSIKIIRNKNQLPSLYFQQINSVSSESLKDLIAPYLKKSDNLFFDSLYLTIANQYYQRSITKWHEGDEVIKELAKQYFSVDFADALFVDGSGLSRYNRIQVMNLAKLLYNGFEVKEFVNSLPRPGEQGGSLFKREILPNQLAAKTGTMSGISCLCGYGNTTSPKSKTFAFVVNNFSPPTGEVSKVMDEFIVRKLGD